MDLLKSIITRRSIRSFKPRPVDKEDLMILVEAAMNAPTSGNLQDLRFIICTDHKIINQLPEFCMDQYWIATAPAVIAVCSQPQIQEKWFGERGRHVFAPQNAAAATQNILITANSLKLGSCWIGGFNQEKVDWVFGVEGKGRVESIITIGYPAEKPDKKKIDSINNVVYFQRFGQQFEDPIKINHDYSIKLANHLKEIEEEGKNFKSKAEVWIKDVNKKMKKHIDNYNQKLKK